MPSAEPGLDPSFDQHHRQLHYRLNLQTAALESAAHGIVIADARGSILWVNHAFAAMTGYSVEEAVGQNFRLLDSGKQDASFYRNLWDTILAGQVWRGELINRRKDGTFYAEEQTITPIRDESGAISHFVAAKQDITERKQRELELESLLSITEQRLHRMAALQAIDQAISSSLDLTVTLGVLLDKVIEQLDVDAADVLLLNPRKETLEYAALRGFRSYSIKYTRPRLKGSKAGEAALTRKLVHLEEPDDLSFLHSGSLSWEGFTAYTALPLVAKGRVMGVLEIFNRAPVHADRDWLSFLEALANQAAIAIDNAMLFEDLKRSNAQIAQAYDTTLSGWVRTLGLRDGDTEGHTRRVTEMTLHLARAVQLVEPELEYIRRGALLHDIGKMGIPDSILRKHGPLTEDERQVIRLHPVYAFELLSPIPFLKNSLDIPYCHHERWDGSGYPRGLRGDEIPLAARLFTVADVWDALTSDRPYRSAWRPERALRYLRRQAGRHFDPRVVGVFLRSVGAPDNLFSESLRPGS